MPRKSAFPLWLVFLLASARGFAAGPEIVTELDGAWAWQRGDNPQWADPSLDDSAWPKMSAQAFANVRPTAQRDGIFWYRQRVQAPLAEDLALELGPIDGACEVFVNGSRIGGIGAFPPHAEWYSARNLLFPIPPGSSDLLIAIRVYRWKLAPQWYSLGIDTAQLPVLGSESVLQNDLALRHERLLLRQFPAFEIGLLCLIVGCVALELYRRDRTDVQHFWLGIAFVFAFLDGSGGILSVTTTAFPVLPFMLAATAVNGIEQCAAVLFLGACISRRPPLFVKVLGVAFMAAIMLTGVAFAIAEQPLAATANRSIDLWLPASVILGLAVAARTASKREPNAPVLAIGVTAYEVSLVWAFRLRQYLPQLPATIPLGPFEARVPDLGTGVFAVCMFYVLVKRFLRLREEREQLGQEFEAARRVQTLLVPARPPETPGFVVNADYTPAKEVGGDFYQILPAGDGSVLVLVGDVSGKGLRAAMLVSHIIGGLRHEPSRRPSEVLQHLNTALMGQTDGGFVTCGCALLDKGGCVTLANAGHIYPYRNGEELEVPSGLPLGLIANPAYPETRIQIVPGDRLTFVSDGVVEARNAKGELFGFDRTRQLSMQPADAISRAAQSFGQDDDITVVTIAMQPA
jgi:hypothetical protein